MGFFGIDRVIREHWIYQDAEYLKVWLEMLLLARFSEEPHTELIDGDIVTVHYGQFIYGRIKWSQRLKVSEQRLRTLIAKLKKEKMIDTVLEHRKCTVYAIVNYSKFNQQNNHQSDHTQQGNKAHTNQQNNLLSTSSQPAVNQQLTTKEQGSKKVNKDNKVKQGIFKPFTSYGDYVQMTEPQYESLINDLGYETTHKYILSIDDWFAQDNSRLKKYSDHSRMIRTWKRNDDNKPMTVFSGGQAKSKPSVTSKIQEMYQKALEDERREANGGY